MSAPSADDLFVELTSLTSLSREEWERILSLPPDLQALTLENYRDQDWTGPGTSTGDRVLAILVVLGTIAGVVSGVAGAAGAVAALRNIGK